MQQCHGANLHYIDFWHGATVQTLGSEKKNRFVFDEFEPFLMFKVLRRVSLWLRNNSFNNYRVEKAKRKALFFL